MMPWPLIQIWQIKMAVSASKILQHNALALQIINHLESEIGIGILMNKD